MYMHSHTRQTLLHGRESTFSRRGIVAWCGTYRLPPFFLLLPSSEESPFVSRRLSSAMSLAKFSFHAVFPVPI